MPFEFNSKRWVCLSDQRPRLQSGSVKCTGQIVRSTSKANDVTLPSHCALIFRLLLVPIRWISILVTILQNYSYNLTLSLSRYLLRSIEEAREGLRRLLLNNSLANCCARLAGKIHARTRASDRHPARIHKPRAKRHRGHFMARLPPQLYCSNTSQFSPCRCESLIVSSLVSSLSQSATIVARMLITVHTLQKR